MDANKIAHLYGSQDWIYPILLKATAIKFNRWKQMLNEQCPDETDAVAEAMARYARYLCCSEISTAASHLHDTYQDGSLPTKKPLEELRTAIDRLSALAKVSQ